MRSRTLLLIEDDPDTLAVYGSALRRYGYRVLEARDAFEGLLRARDHQPDLILMDLGLPGLDGWGATHALRLHPATADIPVMALSVHSRPFHRARAELAGCDRFLAKPCSPAELRDQVECLLGSRRFPTATVPAGDLLKEYEMPNPGRRAGDEPHSEASAQRQIDEEVRASAEAERVRGELRREEQEESLRSEEALRQREERLRLEAEWKRIDAEEGRSAAENVRQAATAESERTVRDSLAQLREQMEILREMQRTLGRLSRTEEPTTHRE